MKTFYLSLGSNLADKKRNLEEAILDIAKFAELKKISSIYQTEPYGYKEQDDFYNCVVSFESNLNADDFMLKLLDIEKKMGRVRAQKNGPRIIDIDIIAIDSLVYSSSILTVPHPRFKERKFVLEPLSEVSPNLVLLDKTIHQYLKSCEDELEVVKVKGKLDVSPV